MRDVVERQADYTRRRGEEEEHERKERRKGKKAQVIDWQTCKLTVTGNSFLFLSVIFIVYFSLLSAHNVEI